MVRARRHTSAQARTYAHALTRRFAEQARAGDAEAQYRYAQWLWYARATETADKVAAVGLLDAAARAAHGKAAWFLRQRTVEPGGSDVVAALGLSSEAELKAAQAKWFGIAFDAGLPAAIHEKALEAIKSEVDKAGGLANPKCRQALHWLVKAAEQGNLDSMHMLGLIFDSGELVQQDIEEAIRWYRAAVEKGHAGAAYNLGLCYENHLVDPHMHDVRLAATTSKEKYSRTAALDLYKLSAERGHMLAQFKVGQFSEEGVGCVADGCEASRWYVMAAEQGSPHAQYRLGLLLDSGFGMRVSPSQAFEKYIIAARAGIPQAQFNIGVAFDKGKVVQPNAETAVHWYKLASDQDLAEAQCNLGVCYESGKGGIVPDQKLAVSLYRISAEQGRNACGCCNLGMCYLKGVEVAKDPVDAALWIGRSATLGNLEAQLAMALLHVKGLGVPEDHEQAISWLRLAVAQGHSTAMTALALCYQAGVGVLQDTEQAVTLYLDAAVAKNTFATYLLGVVFDQGIGVHVDSGSAFEWYRKAAELGHARAQLCLGLKIAAYSSTGDAEAQPNPNWKSAVRWLKLAADQGDLTAQVHLGVCYIKGDGVHPSMHRAFELISGVAEKKQPTAQFVMGWLVKVPGDELDSVRATGWAEKLLLPPTTWFERAAKQGASRSPSLTTRPWYPSPTYLRAHHTRAPRRQGRDVRSRPVPPPRAALRG